MFNYLFGDKGLNVTATPRGAHATCERPLFYHGMGPELNKAAALALASRRLGQPSQRHAPTVSAAAAELCAEGPGANATTNAQADVDADAISAQHLRDFCTFVGVPYRLEPGGPLQTPTPLDRATAEYDWLREQMSDLGRRTGNITAAGGRIHNHRS